MADQTNDMCRGHGERLAALETKMGRVEEGVSNFREFQSEARDFFSRADERAQNETAFHNLRDQEIKDALEARDKVLNRRLVIIGLILSILALWPIIKDMGIRIGISTSPISSQSAPQDAKIPPVSGN
jgi:hypothetical protein